MIQDACSQCNPFESFDHLCGDMNMEYTGICMCSNETLLPWSENPVCCVQDGGCTKSNDTGNEVIHCPNGIVQGLETYCQFNDKCLSLCTNDHSTKCKTGNGRMYCSRTDKIGMFCRGVPVCDEYNEVEQLECENKQDECPKGCFNCPQVPKSKFENRIVNKTGTRVKSEYRD